MLSLPFWVLPAEYREDQPVIGLHLATGILIKKDTMEEWQAALRELNEREQKSKLIEWGCLGPGAAPSIRRLAR